MSQAEASAVSDFTYGSIYPFQYGQTRSCQPVWIIDDERDENTETFTLSMQPSASYLTGIIVGSPGTTTVYIRDNDGKAKKN